MKNKNKGQSTALRIVRSFFPKVLKVKDADGPLIVEVTKEDNKNSHVREHNGCAMAVACKRTTKADGVIIAVKTAYVINGTTATRYKLPESISREIVSFDREAGFDVGAYRFVPYSPSAHLGVTHSRDESDRHTNSGPARKFKHLTSGIRTVLGSTHGEGIRR
jgi:hypothetical protein